MENINIYEPSGPTKKFIVGAEGVETIEDLSIDQMREIAFKKKQQKILSPKERAVFVADEDGNIDIKK